MKALFAILISCILAPEQGMAKAPKAAKAKGVCEQEAQNLADYMEHMSWGKRNGYVPQTKSASHYDSVFTYFIKVGNAKDESVSGYTYQIDITKADDSEACIVTAVNTDGTDQAE